MRGDRRISRLPSPALTVAIVALTAAIAASAVALPGRNSVNSGDIRNGAVKQSDQAQDQRTEWVLIDLQTQAILKQSGGISIADGGSNHAYVDFGHRVRNRPLYARAQLPLGAPPVVSTILCGPPPQGVECDDPNPSDNTHVYVQSDADDIKVYLAVLPK